MQERAALRGARIGAQRAVVEAEEGRRPRVARRDLVGVEQAAIVDVESARRVTRGVGQVNQPAGLPVDRIQDRAGADDVDHAEAVLGRGEGQADIVARRRRIHGAAKDVEFADIVHAAGPARQEPTATCVHPGCATVLIVDTHSVAVGAISVSPQLAGHERAGIEAVVAVAVVVVGQRHDVLSAAVGVDQHRPAILDDRAGGTETGTNKHLRGAAGAGHRHQVGVDRHHAAIIQAAGHHEVAVGGERRDLIDVQAGQATGAIAHGHRARGVGGGTREGQGAIADRQGIARHRAAYRDRTRTRLQERGVGAQNITVDGHAIAVVIQRAGHTATQDHQTSGIQGHIVPRLQRSRPGEQEVGGTRDDGAQLELVIHLQGAGVEHRVGVAVADVAQHHRAVAAADLEQPAGDRGVVGQRAAAAAEPDGAVGGRQAAGEVHRPDRAEIEVALAAAQGEVHGLAAVRHQRHRARGSVGDAAEHEQVVDRHTRTRHQGAVAVDGHPAGLRDGIGVINLQPATIEQHGAAAVAVGTRQRLDAGAAHRQGQRARAAAIGDRTREVLVAARRRGEVQARRDAGRVGDHAAAQAAVLETGDRLPGAVEVQRAGRINREQRADGQDVHTRVEEAAIPGIRRDDVVAVDRLIPTLRIITKADARGAAAKDAIGTSAAGAILDTVIERMRTGRQGDIRVDGAITRGVQIGIAINHQPGAVINVGGKGPCDIGTGVVIDIVLVADGDLCRPVGRPHRRIVGQGGHVGLGKTRIEHRVDGNQVVGRPNAGDIGIAFHQTHG